MKWYEIIFMILTYGIFFYSVTILFFYMFIGFYSIGETLKYIKKNRFTDYRILASSAHTPTVSIIAPAYNEGATIIENVRSLLSIYYSNLEVIIVNDGSKDDSLKKLIKAYDLQKVDHFVQYKIPTKNVKGVYKSRNRVYKRLVVVDKENGGKADALNVGINIAENDLIVCIDVDCILEQDALLKMVKPFLEFTEYKVIAAGGVVRIANSCIIEDGKLVKVRLPEEYLPRMQSLEYIRAFLLGRMAWTRLNGLLLISGAFGAFDKDLVIKVGGYNHETVGEDMELVVRMRRYMEEQKEPYKVTYIPDPLCWTEAPNSYKILGRQRNRWIRGTIETMWLHKKMFFNPNYRLLGMLSYPYWFFFEMCSPLIEFFGFIAFLIMAFIGFINWEMFFAFFAFIISFGYLYSSFAIFMEVATYNQYKRRIDILRLYLTGLLEPFYFHPFVVVSAIKGYVDLIRKKNSWGEMTRQGFNKKITTPTQATTIVEETESAEEEVEEVEESKVEPTTVQPVSIAAALSLGPTKIKEREVSLPEDAEGESPGWFMKLLDKTVNNFRSAASYVLAILLLIWFMRLIELLQVIFEVGVPKYLSQVLGYSILKDTLFALQFGGYVLIIVGLIKLIHEKLAKWVAVVVLFLLSLIHLSLSQYFLSTSVTLGSDLWGYSWEDIKITIGASGKVNLISGLTATIVAIILLWILIKLPQKLQTRKGVLAALTILSLLAATIGATRFSTQLIIKDEFENNLATNKSAVFYNASYKYFFPTKEYYDIYDGSYGGSLVANENLIKPEFIDEENYPFLRKVDSSVNVLDPFFDSTLQKPDIVFIIVEGLGRSYANDGAVLGNFTPFLNELSKQSLYWENCLSASGRTFAVLPTLMGSVPYAQTGFTSLENQMPKHISLLNAAKQSGYKTNFFAGVDAKFDNFEGYLKLNKIDAIYDEKTFSGNYKKMPKSDAGFTWGYGDKELFSYYNTMSANIASPRFDVLLTISMHSPFITLEQDKYKARVEQRFDELKFDQKQKTERRAYINELASIMYTDDALKNLITAYQSKPAFKNTIFIITGDHRMPEIPIGSKIDRYHVPFIIYSPALIRTAKFSSIISHFDVVPSLYAFLQKRSGFKPLTLASWVGMGLDTSRRFRNNHEFPLKQTKTILDEYVWGKYFMSGSILYEISPDMNIEPITEPEKFAAVQNALKRFQNKLNQFSSTLKLMPDSLLFK